MWELFAFGTFWFYLLIVGYLVGTIILTELDRAFYTTMLSAAVLAAIITLGNGYILSWTLSHPWYIATGCVSYVLIGMVWAVVKWTFYTRSIEEFIREHQLQWIAKLQDVMDSAQKLAEQAQRYGESSRGRYTPLTEQQISDYTESIQSRTLIGMCVDEWNTYVVSWEKDRREKKKARVWIVTKPLTKPTTMEQVKTFVDENKSKVIGWMAYWPTNAAWTFLNDPLRKLAKQCFKSIRGILEAIAARTFGVQVQAKSA